MKRQRRAMLSGLALLLAVIAGCAPTQGEIGLPIDDIALYTSHVHPLLEGSCATLDCHGAPGRPLRLYSETGLRIADSLRTAPGLPLTPLTEEEFIANVQSIAAVDATETDVDARVVLLKPLSNTGGGIHHFGGQIWSGPEDVAYRCVRSWMLNAIDDAACGAAAARDSLPPP
jgi:hypothetical protein